MSVPSILPKYLPKGIIMRDVSESMQQMIKQPHCRKTLIIIVN